MYSIRVNQFSPVRDTTILLLPLSKRLQSQRHTDDMANQDRELDGTG